MSDTTPGEAGWQPDPSGKHDHRYWDGSAWTDNVSDAGVASTDPYVAAAAAAAEPPAPVPPVADTAPTDPTVTAPLAAPTAPTDATAAFSAGGPPPPAAFPPVPAAAGGDGSSGGGSKKGLIIGGAILAVVAIIVAVLALGGSDDKSDDELQAKLASAIVRSTGVSNDDADCLADYLVANVDHDTLNSLDFSSDDRPAEIGDDIDKGAEKCGLTGEGSTTTTEGSSDDSTTTTEFTDDTTDDTSGTTDAGIDYSDYKDIIVNSLTQSGLSADQADCLADHLIEAMENGDISEEDVMTAYQQYFADCDIDPADFGN